jgi:hypothetical protein
MMYRNGKEAQKTNPIKPKSEPSEIPTAYRDKAILMRLSCFFLTKRVLIGILRISS